MGTWVSEGSDLSDLFAGFPFEYRSIEASFRADGTVVTEIVDKDGASYITSGTYTIDATTTPASINLQQVEPYQAVLVGIYQVSGAELTYEVEAKVGGKLAQLGSRIVDGFARKMADEFFENFQEVIEGPKEPEDDASEDGAAKPGLMKRIFGGDQAD